jgi:ABC-type sulfate transport system substrate-binding protein
LDNQPVDLGLQRDIQRVSTDVKKLEEEWDTDMTDIEYVKKLYEEK